MMLDRCHEFFDVINSHHSMKSCSELNMGPLLLAVIPDANPFLLDAAHSLLGLFLGGPSPSANLT